MALTAFREYRDVMTSLPVSAALIASRITSTSSISLRKITSGAIIRQSFSASISFSTSVKTSCWLMILLLFLNRNSMGFSMVTICAFLV